MDGLSVRAGNKAALTADARHSSRKNIIAWKYYRRTVQSESRVGGSEIMQRYDRCHTWSASRRHIFGARSSSLSSFCEYPLLIFAARCETRDPAHSTRSDDDRTRADDVSARL